MGWTDWKGSGSPIGSALVRVGRVGRANLNCQPNVVETVPQTRSVD